jgi:hypothetical protein
MAYFAVLKNLLLKGQLSLPENESERGVKKKTSAALRDLRFEYQQAVTDHQHLNKSIQLIMNTEDCTFDKALRKMQFNDLWKAACQRLETIKKQLKASYPIPMLQ